MSKVVKYTLLHTKTTLPPSLLADTPCMQALDSFRTELFDKAFIGLNALGVNFGNVSCRVPKGLGLQQNSQASVCSSPEFLISGTATGKHRILGAGGYALVSKACCTSNTVEAQGLTPPSSEALSHAAVYTACPAVHAVVHGHHAGIHALGLASHVPLTEATLSYGTPAVAEAIGKIVAGHDAGFFIMLGHENGFFVYGCDIVRVEKHCRDLLMQSKVSK